MNHKIFLCENTLEGIFSGIYEAWKQAGEIGHNHCRIETRVPSYHKIEYEGEAHWKIKNYEKNYELFSEYVDVKPDTKYALSVINTICERMGQEVYEGICMALAAEASDLMAEVFNNPEYDKGNSVYKLLVAGFKLKYSDQIMDHLTNPYVANVFKLIRRVGNETCREKEFLRFKELKNGVLFAKIGPDNNVLNMIAPHFADRFPLENFMIFDEKRKLFVVHERKKAWVMVQNEDINISAITDFAENELYYEDLFKMFCKTIAIEERTNQHLQQQMCPLKFQKYMLEFD